MERSIESRVCSQKLQKCSDGVPQDRLSNLPDSLIRYILSFLSTKFVVRTSLLSRRWKSIWTEVNSFDFDDSCLEDIESRSGFVDFINWVLIRNKSKAVEKFHLMWWHSYKPIPVERWISDAIGRNVKVLQVRIGYHDDEDDDDYYERLEVHLPLALFVSKVLDTLDLDGPFLFKVPKSVSLPKLTVLILKAVVYESDDSFHKLTCGSPVLSSLTIEREVRDNFMRCHISSGSLRRLQFEFSRCYSQLPPQIKIDAPSLEYFFVKDDVMPNLSFNGLTSLCEVGLDICKEADDADAIAKAVQAVHCTEFLKLSQSTCLALNSATTKLSTRFEKLTKLELELPCCRWSFLTNFLHCLVKLEVLDIRRISSGCAGHITCWRKPMRVPECMLYSLVHVLFGDFKGLADELKLVKYILKHGLVMKRINVSSYAAPEERCLILKKLLMFSRASSSCQIEFCEM